jgi:hypothetical protein
MKASNGKNIGRLVALTIPLGLFLSLAACVVEDGPTGLVITQDQWLEAGTEASTCTVPVAATANKREDGILDVAVPTMSKNGYLFYPVVVNQLGAFTGLAGGAASPTEEKNVIVLNSLGVKLSVASADPAFKWTNQDWGDSCSGEFDSPVNTSRLLPGGSTSTRASIIRPCNASQLFAYLDAQYTQTNTTSPLVVTATVRAKGHLGSGGIESPPFDFKITVCYGCLQSDYPDPLAAPFYFPNVPRCSDLTNNPYLGDPCNPAQDQLVLCCAKGVDSSGNPAALQCPAVPTGKTTTP